MQVMEIPVTAAVSGEECVRGADIIVTSTTSTTPVLEGKWVTPGMHINAIGANFPQKHELDAEAVRKCNVVTADSRAQSKLESGDLIQMYGDDDRLWRETTLDRTHYIARGRDLNTHPHTIVTTDLDELSATLLAGQQVHVGGSPQQ